MLAHLCLVRVTDGRPRDIPDVDLMLQRGDSVVDEVRVQLFSQISDGVLDEIRVADDPTGSIRHGDGAYGCTAGSTEAG